MDPARVATPSRFLVPRTDRRRLLGALVGVGLLTVSDPRRTRAQEATPEPLARFAGETFVGETSDPTIFVAVVLGEETGAGPRPARGYLCDALEMGVMTWLLGEATGDRVEVAAEDGTTLTGIVTAAGVGGGATLPDGRSLVFAALPVTGIAGLYTVEMVADGRMAGTSANGGQLVGALASEGTPEAGWYHYRVTLTPPDGGAVAMGIRTETADEGEFRIIVLADGQGRGQGKTRRKGDWINPDAEP